MLSHSVGLEPPKLGFSGWLVDTSPTSLNASEMCGVSAAAEAGASCQGTESQSWTKYLLKCGGGSKPGAPVHHVAQT